MNDTTNLVSIVVPIFNSSKWIENCIESILKQNYENIELILINDGSTDNSEIICQKWIKIDNRVQYFYQDNSGVSSARNIGINIAKGKYICFVDSDDWLDPQYVSSMMETASLYNSDITISGIIHEFSRPKIIIPRRLNLVKSIFDEFETGLMSIFQTGLLYSPCVNLYKKNIIVENRIRFNEIISYGEDRLFNLDYIKHCQIISTVPSAHYHYRHASSNSLSNLPETKQLNTTLFLFQSNEKFFREMKFVSCKAKYWLYTPLYDAFSNHILSLKQFHQTNNLTKLYKLIRELITSKECKDAVKHANVKSYPFFLNFMIRYRLTALLSIFVYLKKG